MRSGPALDPPEHRPRGMPQEDGMQVGFICYDLQEFTADCLARVARLLPFRLKAYPLLDRIARERVTFPYLPGHSRGWFIAVRRKGYIPEGLLLSVNVGAAWRCVWESRVVVHFGIHGPTAVLATCLSILLRRWIVCVSQTLAVSNEVRRVWWVRLVKGWILRRSHVHVVQTPVTRETLAAVYGIPPDRCIDAPFDAGASVFRELYGRIPEDRETIRRKWGLPDGCVFLFVGTLLRFKGVGTLLRAACELTRQDPTITLLLVGGAGRQTSEPSLESWRAEADALGIGSSVQFVGQRPLRECAEAYRAADVFVLPTSRDMWPKVLVEAALAGLPLITTERCGAAGSLVLDGRNGFVVPADDPGSLARAMRMTLDPRIRQSMGVWSRDIVDRLCDAEREAEGFRTAIMSLLSTRMLGKTADAREPSG
jgi:glycosyltransferase involved in cell wall biosynthesis